MGLETEAGEKGMRRTWTRAPSVNCHPLSLLSDQSAFGWLQQVCDPRAQVLDPVQAAQPTNKASDPLRALKETAQSMQVSCWCRVAVRATPRF